MRLPSTNRDTANRSPLAWAISVGTHATLLMLAAWLIRSVPRGASPEPLREAGIVLKRSTDQGDLYEGEQDIDERSKNRSDSLAETDATSDAAERLAALPSESALPDVGEMLPQEPLPGAGAAAGATNAASLTTGGGGQPRAFGQQGRTQVFGVEGVGSRFVYVFDRSVSMGENRRLAAAQSQLIESLKSLDSVHQFQIIYFNHQLSIFDATGGQNRVAFATEENKQYAANFIGQMTADGGTDRFAALSHALRLRPDVIFFLTDADDPMPTGELITIAAQNRRVQASINTIEFGRGPSRRGDNFLKRLARESGGRHGYVDATRLSGGRLP